MTETVLILGANGRFGRHAKQAFTQAGWRVRVFDRSVDDLQHAARGVDVIVNGWNPLYPDWAERVPQLTKQVIAAAKAVGATVIVPGNVYVYGPDAPDVWGVSTPHRAANRLGKIRREMEQAYRESGVRTILLRAGDFIDTEASGNWFDMILTKHIVKGKLTYPGARDLDHAWAYLPDLARAAVMLAQQRDQLNQFEDVPFAGFTLTGHQLAAEIAEVMGRPVRLKSFDWWMLRLAAPVWKLAPYLLEMRYLWNTAHRLDGARFEALLPDFVHADLGAALRRALPQVVVRPQSRSQKSRSTQTSR